jgi:hypothetical protein
VKHNQRLGYQRLAEALVERGLVETQTAREALQAGARDGVPFPEVLLGANELADWELSRTVCEAFHLPFLSVEQIEPDSEAAEGIDPEFLAEHGLIVLGRHGRALTVSMPALVPAEVLAALADRSGCAVLPVVGTVRSNRRWIEERRARGACDAAPALTLEAGTEEETDWSELFDAADAAVLHDIEAPDLTEDSLFLAGGDSPGVAETPDEDPVR